MLPVDVRGRHHARHRRCGALRDGPSVRRCGLGGHTQVFNTTLIDPQGRPRQFEASYIPDIIGGEVRGFYCHAVDITDRLEAERVRDAALRLFQISMANAPFGEAVLTTTGRVLRVNPALCHLLGYRSEEMVGADYRAYVHPADVTSGEDEMASLLTGSVQQISSERRYLCCDGSVIWLQRTAVLAPVPSTAPTTSSSPSSRM